MALNFGPRDPAIRADVPQTMSDPSLTSGHTQSAANLSNVIQRITSEGRAMRAKSIELDAEMRDRRAKRLQEAVLTVSGQAQDAIQAAQYQRMYEGQAELNRQFERDKAYFDTVLGDFEKGTDWANTYGQSVFEQMRSQWLVDAEQGGLALKWAEILERSQNPSWMDRLGQFVQNLAQKTDAELLQQQSKLVNPIPGADVQMPQSSPIQMPEGLGGSTTQPAPPAPQTQPARPQVSPEAAAMGATGTRGRTPVTGQTSIMTGARPPMAGSAPQMAPGQGGQNAAEAIRGQQNMLQWRTGGAPGAGTTAGMGAGAAVASKRPPHGVPATAPSPEETGSKMAQQMQEHAKQIETRRPLPLSTYVPRDQIIEEMAQTGAMAKGVEGLYATMNSVMTRDPNTSQAGQNIAGILQKIIRAFGGRTMPKQPPAPQAFAAGSMGVIDSLIDGVEGWYEQYGATASADEVRGMNEILSHLSQARLNVARGPGRQAMMDASVEKMLQERDFFGLLSRGDPALMKKLARQHWTRAEIMRDKVKAYGPKFFDKSRDYRRQLADLRAEAEDALINWDKGRAQSVRQRRRQLDAMTDAEYRELYNAMMSDLSPDMNPGGPGAPGLGGSLEGGW